jgi:hypothetical protein
MKMKPGSAPHAQLRGAPGASQSTAREPGEELQSNLVCGIASSFAIPRMTCPACEKS